MGNGVVADGCSSGDREVNETARECSYGVGPWPGPFPDGKKWDRDLLVHGDRRNVEDEFRYWTNEAISDYLDARPAPLQIAIENVEHDFNIGSIVRTANAFGVRTVHIVGRRRWNRRGAMVTDRYLTVRHHATPGEFGQWAKEEGLPLVGIDKISGSTPLEPLRLPKRCVLVFGQESSGLTSEIVQYCTGVHHISQHGSTRSINVGHAAAIAMYHWILQHSA